MENVLLVTNGFPFGDSERGFIQTEFEELIENFHITILARDKNEAEVYPIPRDIWYGKYYCTSKIGAIPRILPQLKRAEVCSDIKASCNQGDFYNKLKCFLKIVSYSERSTEIEKQIEEIVIEQNINLIYTYWCTQATVAALRLKMKNPDLKVITRFHGCDLYEDRIATRWQILRPYIAEHCDKLIFVSEEGRQYFINRWGQKEKTLVSYLGTGSRERVVLKENGTLVLVSCAYLSKWKRVDLILNALQLLPKEQKVEWHHYGDGELEEELKAAAERMSKNNRNQRYFFHGKVPNDKIEEEYHKIGAQLFITTSAAEGLPVSMMEAISMGIPTIGTSVNGIPELIEDEKSGFLLPADPTPQQVADSIMKYVDLSYAEKQGMSDAAYIRWEEKFNAKKNALKLVEILKQI